MFSLNSRYHGLGHLKLEVGPDEEVAYVRRRIIAPPERFELLQEHVVSGGERPDQIAAQHLGDPEQFWRIADANNVLAPQELTEPVGRRIRITLPEGIPGAAPDA
jgi:hypothetical protein